MISKIVRDNRIDRGLTMADLSDMTGLSTGQISDIENGKKTDIRLSTLIKLADAFDISLDELAGRNRKL